MTSSIDRGAARWLCALALAALAGCAGAPRAVERAPSATVPQGVPATPAGAASTRLAQQGFDAAQRLLREGDREGARAAFERLSREHPQFSGPLVNLGILHAQAGRRGEAISAFARAAVVNPRNAVAHNWLGSLYREGGDYARAEQAYRRALEAQPDYAPAHRNLGILYELHLRRPQEALAHYREYQRRSGEGGAIVGAWIRNLEQTAGVDVAGAQP